MQIEVKQLEVYRVYLYPITGNIKEILEVEEYEGGYNFYYSNDDGITKKLVRQILKTYLDLRYNLDENFIRIEAINKVIIELRNAGYIKSV